VPVRLDAANGRGARVGRWAAVNVTVWGTLLVLNSAVKTARGQSSFARLLVENLAVYVPTALLAPGVAWLAARARRAWAARDGAMRAPTPAPVAWLVGGAALYVVAAGAFMGALETLPPLRGAETVAGASALAAVPRYLMYNLVMYVAIVAVILAYVTGRESQERAVRAARVQAELQVALAEARLHALATQLQPHFLFNPLHAISALVRHDPRRAEQLIARLSELLREMLDAGERVEVPLDEELAFLQKYVDIQEARFGDRLRVTFDVAPAARDARVPRLLLQPLVENAIRHGIARRGAAGHVAVRATCAEGRLTLIVEDDGVGLRGAVREGVGLRTTRERLAHLHGDAAACELAPRAGGGAACIVRLPMRELRA
jgi:signal transduction histidine kinase